MVGLSLASSVTLSLFVTRLQHEWLFGDRATRFLIHPALTSWPGGTTTALGTAALRIMFFVCGRVPQTRMSTDTVCPASCAVSPTETAVSRLPD